jgi:hypothetical protein
LCDCAALCVGTELTTTAARMTVIKLRDRIMCCMAVAPLRINELVEAPFRMVKVSES